MNAYNFGRRLKTLKGLTPFEFVCRAWQHEPERFTSNPLHQMPGLNSSLPMSTLVQLQSSITQTQSLLRQPQNIAFNVQGIEQAFSTSYGTAAGFGSTNSLFAAAQTRWQNSVAAFEDNLKVRAGLVGKIR